MAAYSIFCITCIIFATPFSEWILKQSGKSFIFTLSVISTWGSGISYIAINQLRWERKPQKYALTGLFTSIVTIGLTIILVLLANWVQLALLPDKWLGTLLAASLQYILGKHRMRSGLVLQTETNVDFFYSPGSIQYCLLVMIYINGLLLIL